MRGIRTKHAEYSCDLRAANHPRSRFHPVENVVNVSLAYPPSWKLEGNAQGIVDPRVPGGHQGDRDV